jgi:DNA-binding XRE family transcriptional regulator
MVAPATQSVRELRAALGLSQAKFAKQAGISRHSVIRAELGRTSPARWCKPLLPVWLRGT